MTAFQPTGRDLLHRWALNPILDLRDTPFRCNAVFNGTSAKHGGETVMIVRVEGQEGYSFFALARSRDGLHFALEEEPWMVPAAAGPFAVWEEHGIEDPRLTWIDGTGCVLYTAVGRHGHRIALARTADFAEPERVALVSGPGNKDGVLFPRKIGGLYARLDRPIAGGVGSVWISYSPDLVHWGRSQRVFGPRARCWDGYRVGASAPPIETEAGWLEIYHGVRMTAAGPIYRTGTIMLDRDDPSRVVGRCLAPVLSPHEPYERVGDVGNVVFACGAVVEEDGEVRVYYGAADTSICVASAPLAALVESALQCCEL